ncbi:MAG: ABC transporter substrate-binding protein, partial [Mailhella sp.]|nr:ABC transporter substrate-binding protein [Mailhella sp.]
MKLSKQCFLITLLFFVFTLSSCVQTLPISNSLFNPNDEEAWVQDLVGKTSAEQSEIAAKVWSDSSKPLKLRDRATYILASRNNANTKVALSSLASQYAQSTDEYKKYMEETLFHDLNAVPDTDLTANLKLISPSSETYFPYNLIIFTAAKRGLLPNNQEILSKFKNQNYFKSPYITIEKTPTSNYVTAQNGSVAMLLPQSGPYSTFSRQIITGAKIAQKLLQEQGIQWNITFIDTQDPNWISYLEELPQECAVIGGPLQTNIYQTLYNSKLTSQKIFFTFLTRLPEHSMEGVDAWRFFTSPEDQITAVLNVAQKDLGIKSFGSFYQNNTYGKGMNTLFTNMAKERGLSVYSMAYSDKDVHELNSITQKFLDSRTPEKGKLPIAKRPIDAIFFPDVWKKMDMIISY